MEDILLGLQEKNIIFSPFFQLSNSNFELLLPKFENYVSILAQRSRAPKPLQIDTDTNFVHIHVMRENTAIPSKNTVSANIKHNRYFHKRQSYGQSTPMLKVGMYIMFHVVDTALSYNRTLIIC